MTRPSSDAAHADVVDDRQVLDQLAQPDAAGVGQTGTPNSAAISSTARTSFTPPRRQASIWQIESAAGLEELLEHHPVVDVLAGRDADRRHGAGDRRVAEDVVGRGRLLDPVRIELGQPRHPGDRLVDAPALVGVHGHHPVGPDLLADDPRPAPVVLDVCPDLELERASSPRPAPRGRAAGSCHRSSRASRPTSCRRDSRPAGARPRGPRAWGRAHAAVRGPAPAGGRRRCTGSR